MGGVVDPPEGLPRSRVCVAVRPLRAHLKKRRPAEIRLFVFVCVLFVGFPLADVFFVFGKNEKKLVLFSSAGRCCCFCLATRNSIG